MSERKTAKKVRKVRIVKSAAGSKFLSKAIPVVRIARSKPSIARKVTPFNDQLKCHMTYHEINFINAPSLTTAGAYVYSANGLFDPNVTGTGHQPMGFDQLMPMYDHYTVMGAKITVNWDNASGVGIFGAIQISDSPTPLTAPGQIVENGVITYGTITSSVQNKCQMVATVGIEKFMGRPGILTEDDFRGSVAANPVEQVYFIIYAWQVAGLSSVPVNFDVLIEYAVTLTEPKRLTQS